MNKNLSRRCAPLLAMAQLFCLAPAHAVNPGPAPTPPPDPAPPPGDNACLSAPIGFAAQNGGTTGGAGGSVVTVRTGHELNSALAAHLSSWKSDNNHRTVIRIDGT